MRINTSSNEELQDIVNRLVRGLHPERIYLFGSHAHGQAGKG
ncbi:unnamed protein product, partial [marine sediment metagenome]